MISCTEFIWVYNELFKFIEERGGEEAVHEFWQGIADNFLGNLREYVEKEGLAGMHRYWSHTLGEEGGRHTMTLYDDMFIIDMHECPSAKLVHESGRVEPYANYCEHCRWLYPPLLRAMGYDAAMHIISCENGQCRLTVRKK
ncbi:MAG: hypothetical protein ACLFTT_17995 [Candidatus Hydrogenedentota bacterium]